MKDFLLFWPRFIKESYFMYKYRKAAFAVAPQLQEVGCRVDWLGRIYTVVNIKEEFRAQPDLVQQSIVFQALAKPNEVLLKNGLSDVTYPEIEKIKGTDGYLVVMYPENENFNLISFTVNTILTIVVVYALTWIPSLVRWVQTLF
jgi:hypothetical protein|tara:strand:+ start:1713 stop:2147 length:435 start_codon:yes stop_codon:yes gene_type:complete